MPKFEVLFIDRTQPAIIEAANYDFIGEQEQILCFYDNANKSIAHLPTANILYVATNGIVKIPQRTTQ